MKTPHVHVHVVNLLVNLWVNLLGKIADMATV